MNFLIKHPSAWIPIALSIGILLMILTILVIAGIPTPDPNADEGTAAHIFQLWLILEIFMIGFFVARWLPQKPKEAFMILVLQIIAVLAACAPVFILQL